MDKQVRSKEGKTRTISKMEAPKHPLQILIPEIVPELIEDVIITMTTVQIQG